MMTQMDDAFHISIFQINGIASRRNVCGCSRPLVGYGRKFDTTHSMEFDAGFRDKASVAVRTCY